MLLILSFATVLVFCATLPFVSSEWPDAAVWHQLMLSAGLGVLVYLINLRPSYLGIKSGEIASTLFFVGLFLIEPLNGPWGDRTVAIIQNLCIFCLVLNVLLLLRGAGSR